MCISSAASRRSGGGRHVPGLSFEPVRSAALPAVPRTAVPARAGEHDRPRRGGAPARHRSRPLRRPARDGRLSRRPDARHLAPVGAGRAGAADRHDAARHRHHAGRQRSLVSPRRRLLDRAVARRDGGVREPESRHDRALGIRHEIRVIPNFLDCAEYRRRDDPASARTAVPAASAGRARRARLELPAGQARRRGDGGLPPDPRAASAPASSSSATARFGPTSSGASPSLV